MGKELSHMREPILGSSDLLSKDGFDNEKLGLYQSNNGSMNNDMNPKMVYVCQNHHSNIKDCQEVVVAFM